MLFQIALFVLGLVGSLWTTLYALFDYRAERLTEFDDLLHEVLFAEVFPQFCAPILIGRVRQWDAPPGNGGREVYVALRLLLLLSAQEFEIFVSLCIESLCRRRLWLTRKYITRRVRDIAPQYPWHTPLLRHLNTYLADAGDM